MANKTLAFEIGTEELPAFDLHAVTGKLEGLFRAAFDAEGIPVGAVEAYTTPRRLAVVAHDVPARTEATEEVFRGPAAKIAFDAEGNPTKAALGFARGKGVDASSLELRDENGTQYVYAVRRTPERDVVELLPAVLEGVIGAVSWPKTQRWGSRSEQFSRPVRWLLALFGEDVVPVAWAGLAADRLTRGHRFLAPGPHAVACAEEYVDVLRGAFVVPSEAEREAIIREQVRAAEEATGLVAELPAKIMEEVVNLAEYPTVMVGTFDELFLAVPKEITVDAMLVHQRYFPLFNADGTLANKFLITSNGDPAFEANIVDGNERVVAARLYDAKFFYDEDCKRPLADYVERLDEVVFQESLGTMRAKADRIVRVATHLAADAQLPAADAADAARAALLCKADLVTGAVVEFTSVQGVMGYYYALASGEGEQVARAIGDHYRPRFSGDEPPASLVGKVVATADKLDTICGLFAAGQGPTGSSDPFALRRSALGIMTMLLAEEGALEVSLLSAVDASLAAYAEAGLEFDREAVRAEVVDFFVTRTKVMLRDAGMGADAVDAVLAAGVQEPVEFVRRVRALEVARRAERETFDDLATAFARANNLRDEALGADVDPAALADPAERELVDAVEAAEGACAAALEADDYAAALRALAALRAPVDRFFEDVMVMADDEALRANRLRLLNRFVGVFAHVADFGLMAKK
ncbi:glycine--tRNA ligase subunit beta [Adlercreutzia sp. ZJ242]|uniref:glycine--tRNA ligase subunit beta n=1 Tax=Adlercreutzia sp. ZJ242 TaxID=2709409 RepID=UPI0013EA3B73|nr:glycine--tRNA ligase subunit beta [Adlercreutzia sp. ZJ242]